MALSRATQEARERKFASLIARGHSQAEAWRQTFKGSRGKPEHAKDKASVFAKRDSVKVAIREALREAKITDLMSHAEWFDSLQADIEAAREAKNHNALFGGQRIAGQAIGALKGDVNINMPTSSDDEIVKRLAGNDPHKAEMIRAILTPSGFTPADQPAADKQATAK
jgi:hypothetical protein